MNKISNSVNNVVNSTSFKCNCSNNNPEQKTTTAENSQLLAKSLDALAQGWTINTPKEDVIVQKKALEQKGFNVSVRDDGKFVISGNNIISHKDLKNVAEIKGNVQIISGDNCNKNFSDLESVDGTLSLTGFNEECRESGENWGYACDVKFPALKEITGDLKIQKCAANIYLNDLQKIGGSLTVESNSESDNIVHLGNIEEIKGDLNIQTGTVEANSNIFAAVDGKLNAIPPENGYKGFLKTSNKTKFEFLPEAEMIKKA